MGSRHILLLGVLSFTVGCLREDSATADDGGLACKNLCTKGDRLCDGEGFKECVVLLSGCTGWSAVIQCAAGEVCSSGACGETCSDQCAAGTVRCKDGGLQTCVELATGCTDWDTPVACKPAEVCTEDACVPQCDNSCSEGQTRCLGNGVQTCEKLASGCIDWDSAVPCRAEEVCLVGSCIADSSEAHLSKVTGTPDYLQTDPDYGGLPDGGDQYCAPVSVSNSLMWLDDHGFGKLAPDTSDRKKDQFDLIVGLGSSSYMNTNPINGTSVWEVLFGVHNYLQTTGHTYTSLAYQGWREHPALFSTGVEVPELDWIKQGIEDQGAVWLNVGWYTHDPAADAYLRKGGHWVTLVGYGFDGKQLDPSYLILHDPGPWAGISEAHEFVRAEQLSSGTLVGSQTGLPTSAIGFYRLTGGMHLPQAAYIAIVDGAVVLKM